METILYRSSRAGEKVSFSSSLSVFEYMSQHLANMDEVEKEKEYFWVAMLNARNQVKLIELMAIGCLTGSLIHPREVFRRAVGVSAAAVVLCHNHPSGDPTPSPEDMQLTERLVEAGRILGIRVLDHVVIAEQGGYSSLMDRR